MARNHRRNGFHRTGNVEGLWPAGQDVITANLLARQLAQLGVIGNQAQTPTRNDVNGPFTTAIPFRGMMDAIMDPRRSIDEECGYPVSDSGSISNLISAQLFRQLYDREAIANRVVQVLPKECFQVEPTIFETEDEDKVTEFEEALDDLTRSLQGAKSWYENKGSPLVSYWQRVDTLSRIGHFGVLLIGLDDGKNLDMPVDGVSTIDPLGDANEKYQRTRAAFESTQGKGFQHGETGVMGYQGGDGQQGQTPSMGGMGSKVPDSQGGENDALLWSAGQPNADGSQVPNPKAPSGDWSQWEREWQQQGGNAGDYAQAAWRGPSSSQGHSTSNRLRQAVQNARKMGVKYFDHVGGACRVRVGKCGKCRIVVNVSSVDFKMGHPHCPKCKRQLGKLRLANQREVSYGSRAGMGKPVLPLADGSTFEVNEFSQADALDGWVPSVPKDLPHADEVPVYQTFTKNAQSLPEGTVVTGLPQFTGWQKARDETVLTAAAFHRNGNGKPTTNAPTDDYAQYRNEHQKDTQPNKDDMPAYSDAGHTVQLASGAVGTDAQYVGIQLGPSEYFSTKPAQGVRPNVLFLRVYSEDLVQIVQYEANVRNPRFGLPVMYRITLNDPRELHSGIGLPLATVRVHWSRIIHVNDTHANPGSSEIFSPPAMRPVLNRLLDLRKLYGAGAEGYWQAALTILQFVTHPTLGGDVLMDATGLQSQIQNVINSLQRWLMSAGGEWKNIAPDVKDNEKFIAACIEAICICLAIPKRVFMGTERGELASSQDDAKWNDVLRERQTNYISPRIIVPFIDRMILMSVLPEPESYKVDWPDLDSQTDKDKAQIALQKTQALQMYVMGNLESLIPLVPYLVHIWGFSQDMAEEIENEAKDHQEEDQLSQPGYGEPGHPATGEPPPKPPGAGGGMPPGMGGMGGGGMGGGPPGMGPTGAKGGFPAGGGGQGQQVSTAGNPGAKALQRATSAEEDQEEKGEDVSNVQNAEDLPDKVNTNIPKQQPGQGQGQQPQDPQAQMQAQRDNLAQVMEAKQKQQEQADKERKNELDEHRQGLEDELSQDDADDARQVSQQSVSQRIGNDPKKALEAAQDPNVEWYGIDKDELAKRVAALAQAPTKSLLRLQQEKADEVHEKIDKRDDNLDMAEDHSDQGNQQKSDFHKDRAEDHHNDALEAQAVLEAVQEALSKQGVKQQQPGQDDEDDDDDQDDEDKPGQDEQGGPPKPQGGPPQPSNPPQNLRPGPDAQEKLINRLGYEKGMQVWNAVQRLTGNLYTEELHDRDEKGRYAPKGGTSDPRPEPLSKVKLYNE